MSAAIQTAIFVISAGLIFLILAKAPLHPSLKKQMSTEILAEVFA